MSASDKAKLAGRTGGIIGFVLFLVVGLIPSLLFGGHAGKLIFKAIYGYEPTVEVFAKLLVGGGMVLGFALGLFCFVLLGCVVAQGIANLVYHQSAQNHTEEGK